MAETLVKLVLEKISDAAVKEVLHLCGVENQVEKIRHELDWIRAFLQDADTKQILDEMQKQWVKDVREVAYRIEDVIDTFLCEVPQKKPGKRGAIKSMFRKTKKLPVVHKLGDDINQILARLQEINDAKNRYGIKSLGEGSGGAKRLPVKPPILPNIEDPDIIELDTDVKDHIISELLDENTPRRSVVSIVGQGGLGKTTLAKKVYNSNEVHRAFNIRIWVVISQEFELINVLKKIRNKLRTLHESEQENDEEHFLTDIFQSLKEKKYLLIIDDVWSTKLWTTIEKALPNEKNGSRILMTTRIYNVAKEADPAREPYKLSFLSEELSLKLFLKKAIPDREIENKCPSDLFDLAKQFVNKCSGLPLALVVLGSLLAKKQLTHSAWNKVMQTMNWHADEQKDCMEIISTSYDDLPLALKSCFMYFASFPEDFDIDAESLFYMWIAEGFIPHEENRTLEDTAESFLEDLVQRSMVQVSIRSLHNDSIEECRIHDLLRDVAIQKAKEDNVLTVCSTLEDVQSCGRARRVAVHNFDCSELLKYASPNLHTLLCYGTNFPNCSGHKLLKVLSAMGERRVIYMGPPKSDRADMKWIEKLSQLRYLKLKDETNKWNQKSFDKLIGTMKFLQTLDLSSFYNDAHLMHLPDCVWHIKTLRHVMLDYMSDVLGPPPAITLPNLQTLRGIKPRESWDCTNLPNVPNLRDLVIKMAEGFPWGLVAAFLHTLKKLVRLQITRWDISTEVVDMKEFSFYQHLLMLDYQGRLSCNDLNVTMFPAHLTYLRLWDSKLLQDPMIVLEKLQELKVLWLINAYASQKMKFSAGGFPRLQDLRIDDSDDLEELEIEEGAMPMLKDLLVRLCLKLQVPHGLQHLTALTKLTWRFHYGDDSSTIKEKEIRSICKHVPSITIDSQKDNSE